MALATRARFDGVPIWRQLAQEYETAVLQFACFRGDVVPAARTEASIVDDAWNAADARYQTEEYVKAYAQQMLHEAQRFYDGLHGGPKIVICVQDASDPQMRVYCCMKMRDKLQVAIDAYTKMKPYPSIKEIQYGGVPYADQRVYPWNTPDALAMDEHDLIAVFHEEVPQDHVVDRKTAKSYDICIACAEGLVETYKPYTYKAHESFDEYANKFCTLKGLDASMVRFMHGGQEIAHDEGKTICQAVSFFAKSYIPKPGPLMIYVLPKPEFECDPDQCYVPRACLDEQGGAGAAVGNTRVHRQKRPVVKMDL